MIPVLLSFRFVMLIATFGCTVGALIMFWEGVYRLTGAVGQIVSGLGNERLITAAVMGSVDRFLFGIVLVIIAYAITFGFVITVPPSARHELPRWMEVGSVTELKHTFFEVILLYLAVDFATDIASSDTHLSYEGLVMPGSILLLAAAIRLLSHKHSGVSGAASHVEEHEATGSDQLRGNGLRPAP